MKYSLATSCVMLMVLSINGKAQNVDNSSTKARNNIKVYVGVLEGNINYERNISQRPKSYSNLRLGFGHAAFLNAGEGNYINPAFVHLIGEKSSHLEIDLGIKYML